MGNLDAKRDWGYAPEYVECMWRILQQDRPEDFVIGTGEAHSIREFLEEAFGYAGMDYREHVATDPKYFRPTEVDHLHSDPSKARETLGWVPKVKYRELVRIMVDADLELAGLPCPGEGKAIVADLFPDGWHHWGGVVASMESGVREG
jgi:GDPmannose 4,6-dehydratase